MTAQLPLEGLSRPPLKNADEKREQISVTWISFLRGHNSNITQVARACFVLKQNALYITHLQMYKRNFMKEKKGELPTNWILKRENLEGIIL